MTRRDPRLGGKRQLSGLKLTIGAVAARATAKSQAIELGEAVAAAVLDCPARRTDLLGSNSAFQANAEVEQGGE
jgi:hypothetical protein